MPRVKKLYGPNVTVVGKSKRRQPEPAPISPEMERKLTCLAAALAALENGETHGLDRIDELTIQAKLLLAEKEAARAYWEDLAIKREQEGR